MNANPSSFRQRLAGLKLNRVTLGIAAAVIVVIIGAVVAWRARASTTSTASTQQTGTVERGTLISTVSAAGNIKARQLSALAWGTAGTVGTISVKAGDTVQAGQALAELDPASLAPAVIRAQADLITAQQALDELQHPTQLQIGSAQQAVADAQEALRTAKNQLYSAQNPAGQTLKDAVASAKFSLDQAQANMQLSNADPNVAAWQNAVFLTNWYRRQWEDAQAAYDASNGSLELKDKLDQAYNNYQAKLNTQLTLELKINTAQSSTQESLDQAQKNYDTAVKNLNAALAGPDQLQVTLAQAKVTVAEGALAEAQDQLDHLLHGPSQADLLAAQAQVATAQATVNQARLTAPFAGTVMQVSNRVGDSVTAGAAGVTVADRSSLEVVVDVSEVDINKIVVGQAASLTLDAVPDATFTGQVSEVGTVGTVAQGVVNFPVKIVVENPDPALKPGMTAAVNITTEQRDNVLLVPNRAIRASGGQRVVIVLFEGQQISVPVTVGLSNDTHSEILTGSLKEGDTVLTSSAAASTTTRTGGGFLLGGGGFGGP